MIRLMTETDTDAVVRLVVAAEMFSAEDSGIVRDLLRHYLEALPEGHVCVVDDDAGEIVGVAYYQPKGPADRVWDLTLIAVRPDVQGTGRGSTLLHHVERDLVARDQRLLLVDTSGTAQYDRTRDFYVKCGYTREARIRDYWQDDDDLVVFAKRLASTR
jgi:ribosomal protein S18 acetylase RimI-like enzyme